MEAAARAFKQNRALAKASGGICLPARRPVGRRLRQWAAFTLIELMVVVVLIGVVTAMILPEMKGTFEDMLLRSTARSLVSAFGMASSQAITVNQIHRVRVDVPRGQYVVERVAPQSQEMSGFRSVDGLPGAKGELDKRIRVRIHKGAEPSLALPEDRSLPGNLAQARPGATEAIAFYPDGTAEEAEVLLQDREGFGLALRINATTGRVRVREVSRQ